MVDAHDPNQPIAIVPDDWSTFDGGYVRLPNYWLRFWRPALGPTPSALYELLLSYCHHRSQIAYPSVRTLAASLSCDRRTLTGRSVNGHDYPGAIDTLQSTGLLSVHASTGRPRLVFRVSRTPPLLPASLLAQLPDELTAQHDRWLDAHLPERQTVVHATIATQPDAAEPTQPGEVTVVATTPTVVRTPRTQPIEHKTTKKGDEKTVIVTPQFRAVAAWTLLHDFLAPIIPLGHARQSLALIAPMSLSDGTLGLIAANSSTAAAWADERVIAAILTAAQRAGLNINAVAVEGPAHD